MKQLTVVVILVFYVQTNNAILDNVEDLIIGEELKEIQDDSQILEETGTRIIEEDGGFTEIGIDDRVRNCDVDVCQGGVVTVTDPIFVCSPGFATSTKYPNNLKKCATRFFAATDKWFRLTFRTFQVEDGGARCTKDQLVIQDVARTNQNVEPDCTRVLNRYRRLCNGGAISDIMIKTRPYKVRTPYMRFQFTTNNSKRRRGFRVLLEPVDIDDECYGDYDMSEGIVSLRYPDTYLKVYCNWRFRVMDAKDLLYLTCTKFRLNPGNVRDNVNEDCLSVNGSVGKTSYIERNSPAVVSQGQDLFIEFFANRKLDGAGFVCNVELFPAANVNEECTIIDGLDNCKSPLECVDDVCECPSPYVVIGDDCVLISPIPLNEACEYTEECLLATNFSVCNNSVCVCDDGYEQFDDECLTPVPLDLSCSLDGECLLATNNSVCNDTNICDCIEGFVNIMGLYCLPEANLTEDCDFTDQCLPDNSECIDSICQCSTGFLTIEEECFEPKLYNESCTHNEECVQNFQNCSDGRCDCVDGREAQVVAEYEGEPLIECINAIPLNEACNYTEECLLATNFSICNNSECVCEEGFEQFGDECLTPVPLDLSCSLDGECLLATNNSECNDTNICDCIEGFVNILGLYCLPEAAFNESCDFTDQCLPDNSECIEFVCLCSTGYITIDEECFEPKIYNETCTHNEQCIQNFQICTDGQCMCVEGTQEHIVAEIGGVLLIECLDALVLHQDCTDTSLCSFTGCNLNCLTGTYGSTCIDGTCQCDGSSLLGFFTEITDDNCTNTILGDVVTSPPPCCQMLA